MSSNIVATVYVVYELSDDFGVYRYLPDTIYDNEYEARKHVESLGFTERSKPIGLVEPMDVFRFFDDNR
jgi:hypothetical protein